MAEGLFESQKVFITLQDLSSVYRVTSEARNKWKNILLALDVSETTVSSINKRFQGNPKDCYCEGLSEWLKGGKRSFQDLISALSSPTVGHNDIAEEIMKDYVLSTLSKRKELIVMNILSLCQAMRAIVMYRAV